MKTIGRNKFVTLSAYLKKLKRSHTRNLEAHLKVLEQKQEIALKKKQITVNTQTQAVINKIEKQNKQTTHSGSGGPCL